MKNEVKESLSIVPQIKQNNYVLAPDLKERKLINKDFKLTQKPKINFVKICKCEKGNILGLEDSISGRKHATSLKCISTEGAIYKIRADDLFRQLRKDERSWNKIKQIAYVKDAQIKEKMKASQ